MGKFDVLSNGVPFSMDKTKNYVKRDDGTIEEISDLANLANTEVGFIGHKANIHKAELTDRNISVLDEQKAELATYRQALLDVPQQEGFPSEVTWPDKPTFI